jgi:ABC-2 type transport system permease protein
MNALRTLQTRIRRAWEICSAYVWMGATEMLAYPLSIVMMVIGLVIVPVVLYFVNQLVPSQPAVGGDYFTFAALGAIATGATRGGLSAFGGQLDNAVSTGRLENLLVEPIRWRVLPFALAGWPVMITAATMAIQTIIVIALGADIKWSGMPLAALILFGGVAASHAVGILAASVKILSKQSDPILTLYMLATDVLSGTAFPVDLLPAPLRALSYLLPQTYVLSAIRKVLMPDGDQIAGPSATTAVLLLCGFLVVMYPLSLWLFGRALEYGRKVGTLAGY